jgi:hypothetical protein
LTHFESALLTEETLLRAHYGHAVGTDEKELKGPEEIWERESRTMTYRARSSSLSRRSLLLAATAAMLAKELQDPCVRWPPAARSRPMKVSAGWRRRARRRDRPRPLSRRCRLGHLPWPAGWPGDRIPIRSCRRGSRPRRRDRRTYPVPSREPVTSGITIDEPLRSFEIVRCPFIPFLKNCFSH